MIYNLAPCAEFGGGLFGSFEEMSVMFVGDIGSSEAISPEARAQFMAAYSEAQAAQGRAHYLAVANSGMVCHCPDCTANGREL